MKTQVLDDITTGKITIEKPKIHPLDPASQRQEIISYLAQVHKHIRKIPKIYSTFLLICNIGLIINTLIASSNESDAIKYTLLNNNIIRFFGYLGLGFNSIFLIHFIGNIFFFHNNISRSELLKTQKIFKIYILIGLLIRFCYLVFYPIQIIALFGFFDCQNEKKINIAKGKGEEETVQICQGNIYYIELALFTANAIFSIFLNQIFHNFLIGIYDDGDPLSTRNGLFFNFNQFLLLIIQIVKNIITWAPSQEQTQLRVLYAITFFLSGVCMIAKGSTAIHVDKTVDTLKKISNGYFIWLSLKLFLLSFFGGENDVKFKYLSLALNLIFVFKITLNLKGKLMLEILANENENFIQVKKKRKKRDSDLARVTHIFNMLGKLKLSAEKKMKKYDLEILELKGQYLEHQKKCSDIKCSCRKMNDIRYGKNDFRRFRDFFIIQFQKMLQVYPNSFTFLWHSVFFTFTFDKDLKKISANLQKLKKMARTTHKKFRLLQLDLKVENLFIGSYEEKSEIDGQDGKVIGSIDSKEVTLKMANDYAFKRGKKMEYLKLENFITIDRLFNEMIERMKEGIDMHTLFLEKIQAKSTKLSQIHKIVRTVKQLYTRVDNVYRNLRNVSFRFTMLYLLPYAFFKNQTQNCAGLCNSLYKEFKQKKLAFKKIFEDEDKIINNINIEKDSVCMMISFCKETFMDIVYITQTYQQIFGADITFLTANLMDILPPKISGLHQKVVEKYLEKLEATYLSKKKEGLITLKESIYENVDYMVKLFPSLMIEPMLLLYIKKKKVKDNNYLIVLDKKGVIEGFSENLVKLYPSIVEKQGTKIFKCSKDLKKMINHFKFYELAVVQSLKHKASIYLPGFRPSKIKAYKKEWKEMTLDNPNKGRNTILEFGGQLKFEVNFRLKVSYLKHENESEYMVWFYFKIVKEVDHIFLRSSTIKKGITNLNMKTRKSLMKLNYINKIIMFQKENKKSSENKFGLGVDLSEGQGKLSSGKIENTNYSNLKRRKEKRMTLMDMKKKEKLKLEAKKMEKRVNRKKSIWFKESKNQIQEKLPKNERNRKRAKTEKNKNSSYKIQNITKEKHKTSTFANKLQSSGNNFTKEFKLPSIQISEKIIQKNSKYIGFDSNKSIKRQSSNRSRAIMRNGSLLHPNQSKKHTIILTSENELSFRSKASDQSEDRKNKINLRTHFKGGHIKSRTGGLISEGSSIGSTASSSSSNILAAAQKSKFLKAINTNFIVLIIQIFSVSLTFLSLAAIRFYFTNENVLYLSQFRASEANANINAEIKFCYSDIMKLGLIDDGILGKDYFENIIEGDEETDWAKQMRFNNPRTHFLEDIEFRMNRLSRLIKEMKKLTRLNMPGDGIDIIYNLRILVYYYEFWGKEKIKSLEDSNQLKKSTKMNYVEATDFISSIIKQAYREENFNLKSGVPFVTMDKNILKGIADLSNRMTDQFTNIARFNFQEEAEFGTKIVLYCSFFMLGITFLTLPPFIKMRNKITFIYRILQELYNFEIIFKMKILDELEDALDVCQENSKIIEGLVFMRNQ